MRKPFVRKKADDRRSEIINEAYEILISKGYSELTLRGVSKKVCVSLSTVQYHFPSREKLIEALIKERISLYINDYKNIESECRSENKKKIFLFIIRYLVDDCTKMETCVFFTQMWALSFIKKEYKYFVKSLYDHHTDYLKDSLLNAFPSMDESIAADKVMAASCMIEGSLVHFGYEIRSDEETVKHKENLYKELLKLFDMNEFNL